MMAKPINFKVYLINSWKPLNAQEVRKFKTDDDVANNFEKLHERLQNVFPDLRDKNFTTAWKDGEDIVTISTNEELEIALKEMQSGIYKLYVSLKLTVEAATNVTENSDRELLKSGFEKLEHLIDVKLPNSIKTFLNLQDVAVVDHSANNALAKDNAQREREIRRVFLKLCFLYVLDAFIYGLFLFILLLLCVYAIIFNMRG